MLASERVLAHEYVHALVASIAVPAPSSQELAPTASPPPPDRDQRLDS